MAKKVGPAVSILKKAGAASYNYECDQMSSTKFKRLSINDLILMSSAYDGGPQVVREACLFPGTTSRFPPIKFGDVNPDRLNILDTRAIEQWPEHVRNFNEVHSYTLRDAIVHSPYGIITIGDYVLNETLGHIPFHFPGYSDGPEGIEIPKPTALIEVATAFHGAAGNFTNYYHWMFDIVPKLLIEPLAARPFEGVILLPPAKTSAQTDIVRLLSNGPSPILLLNQGHAVRAKSLTFVPNMSGHGFAPNPYIGVVYDTLKRLMSVPTKPNRRLYITRRDSKLRRMLNETAVGEVLEQRGFEIVELTGLSLASQASLFAEATHVVAPHGAGLTNLVFCSPGTKVLELQMNTYLNWCFRNICGIRALEYGCLVGKEEPDAGKHGHQREWRSPIDRLDATLRDPAFLDVPHEEAPKCTEIDHEERVSESSSFAFLKGEAEQPPREIPGSRKGRLSEILGKIWHRAD